MKDYRELLGHKVRDRVTDLEGTVTSVAFDLYGCVSAWVTPPFDKKGNKSDGGWLDAKRLVVLSKQPVMKATFAAPGSEAGPEAKGPPR